MPADQLPTSDSGWISGTFEGTYSGEHRGPVSEHPGARRYSFRVQGGSLHDPQPAPPPTIASEDRLDRRICCDELRHVTLPSQPGQTTTRSTTLYDVRIADFVLSHAVQRGRRSYGRLRGKLLARLRPTAKGNNDARARDGAEQRRDRPNGDSAPGQKCTPATAANTTQIEPQPGRDTSTSPSAPKLRPRRDYALIVVLVGAIITALLLTWRCGPTAAARWSVAVVTALFIRHEASKATVRDSRLLRALGLLCIAAQIYAILGPLEVLWRQGCYTDLSQRVWWLAAPVIVTALLPRWLPLIVTLLLWTATLGAWCAGLSGDCSGLRSAASDQHGAGARPRAATPSQSDRQQEARPIGSSRAGPKMPLGHADPPQDNPPLARGSAGASPNMPRGGSADLPQGNLPRRGDAEASESSSELGWAAPAHQPNTQREATLISTERALRDPDLFFQSRGKRRVYLGADQVFAVGRAKVSEQGKFELAKLAAVLKVKPRQAVVLEVHADGTGSPQKKLTLTRQRAQAAYRWLIGPGHVDKRRLSHRGLGSVYPIVPPDASPAAQQPNRRIEVRLDDTLSASGGELRLR